MTLSAERLNRAKKEIADIVAALKAKDASNVSPEASRLFAEMTALDDAAWNSLLAGLENNDLRDQLSFLRQEVAESKEAFPGAFSQIQQVGHAASFDVSLQSLTVSLHFKAGERSLVSNQDLEDTLWIGAAVLEAVSKAMQGMEDTLGIEARRACIGTDFESNLKRMEDAVTEIRRLHTEILGADACDDGC